MARNLACVHHILVVGGIIVLRPKLTLHRAKYLQKQKMCEDCGLKRPSYGLPSEGRRHRWCARCGKGHVAAQRVKRVHEATRGLTRPAKGLKRE